MNMPSLIPIDIVVPCLHAQNRAVIQWQLTFAHMDKVHVMKQIVPMQLERTVLPQGPCYGPINGRSAARPAFQ